MNQGRDSTIEPAYLAEIRRNSSGSGGDLDARVTRLEELVQELNNTVDGTAAEGYKDGLVSKVRELEEIVAELQEEFKNKIYYDTTANWNSQPQLVAEKGCIYIYSDAKIYQGVPLPRFKVGNGEAYLIDLMFIDQDIVDYLENIVTVTQEEKNFWNDKMRCYVEGGAMDGNLIFTTN